MSQSHAQRAQIQLRTRTCVRERIMVIQRNIKFLTEHIEPLFK